MARLREWAVARLAGLFTRLAIRVAPKPRVGHLPRRWTVTLPEATMTVELWFVQGSLKRGEWHVSACLCYDMGPTLLVDTGIGRCWVQPLFPEYTHRARRRCRPEYVITLRVPAEGHTRHSTIGPVTCVTLAKRLIGVHNPGVVTSRQLLDLLWRMRDGRGE